MVKHIQIIRWEFANELFDCVWPFCGADAERVKKHPVWKTQAWFNNMTNFWENDWVKNLRINILVEILILLSGFILWNIFLSDQRHHCEVKI